MINSNPYHKPLVAAVAGGFLMLVSGWAYRALDTQLRLSPPAISIARAAMEGLPSQIADWIGEDIPLDKAIVRKTGTDAHINRRYVHGSGMESIVLYIGCGARVRDLIVHRPDCCYVAAGWTLTGRSFKELPLGTDSMLPCDILEFSRGGLDTGKIIVAHYYIVDGRYCGKRYEWQYRFWRIGYVAQVQIAAFVTETLAVDEATRIVYDFAVASAPAIAEQFKHIGMRQNAGSVRESRE